MSSSEPGVIRAATMKKVAEEMSPGTVMSCPCSSTPPLTVTPLSKVSREAPNRRNMRSEWSRDRLGSRIEVAPSAYRPASMTADLTWALETGDS